MSQVLGHRHEDSSQMTSCSLQAHHEMQGFKIQLLKIFHPHTDTILGYHPQVEVTTSEYPGSFLINCNHAFGSISN